MRINVRDLQILVRIQSTGENLLSKGGRGEKEG